MVLLGVRGYADGARCPASGYKVCCAAQLRKADCVKRSMSTSPGSPPSHGSLRAIARTCGVSLATASRVLHDHPSVAPATRERVRAALDAAGYQINGALNGMMSQVRTTSGIHARRGTIAFLNWRSCPDHFRNTPWDRGLLEGAERRARELGFDLDVIWVLEPGLSAERLHRILQARNIRGLILPGPGSDYAHKHLQFPWESYATVVLRREPRELQASRVLADSAANLILCYSKLVEYGHRRIGIIMPNYRLSNPALQPLVSAYLYCQYVHQGTADALPICFLQAQPKEYGPLLDPLSSWLREHRPDALITFHDLMLYKLVQQCGLRIPEDVSFAHLSAGAQPEPAVLDATWIRRMNGMEPLATSKPGFWAGIDALYPAIAAKGVDVVCAMLGRHEFGAPANAASTLLPGVWLDGATVLRRG